MPIFFFLVWKNIVKSCLEIHFRNNDDSSVLDVCKNLERFHTYDGVQLKFLRKIMQQFFFLLEWINNKKTKHGQYIATALAAIFSSYFLLSIFWFLVMILISSVYHYQPSISLCDCHRSRILNTIIHLLCVLFGSCCGWMERKNRISFVIYLAMRRRHIRQNF